MNQAQDITSPMSPTERRASFALAGIFMLRMLGLFMILPVFSLYAGQLKGSTPFLTGVAISAYGLTQALLQIPFGMLSDRYGRKLMIALGLLIFASGSVIAALSDSIYGVILGRALQGSGAIAAAVMALAADLTREVQRTKAMAIIGISIGVSFAIAVVTAPVIADRAGVAGIFWLTAGLALTGLYVLFALVPSPAKMRFHRDTEAVPAQFGMVLSNKELLRLDFGILALHMILTAGFVVLPLVLRDSAGIATAHHWYVYLPVLLLSIGAMVPFVIMAEKKRKMKAVFLGAIGLIALAELGLLNFHEHMAALVGFLFMFFTGFNLLEATLPSMISKIAPVDLKGTAMGVYSTSQFLGAFLGGVCGGWIYGAFGLSYVFLFAAVIALLWLIVSFGMKPPRALSSLLLNLGRVGEEEAARISAQMLKIEGVAEAIVLADDGVAYLKVDHEKLDRKRLQALIPQSVDV